MRDLIKAMIPPPRIIPTHIIEKNENAMLKSFEKFVTGFSDWDLYIERQRYMKSKRAKREQSQLTNIGKNDNTSIDTNKDLNWILFTTTAAEEVNRIQNEKKEDNIKFNNF